MNHCVRVLTIVVLLQPAFAPAGSGERLTLIKRYRDFIANTSPIVKTMPLHVRSMQQDQEVNVEVFGVLDQPFSRVTRALSTPRAICEYLPLNLNVKACTHRAGPSGTSLKIYVAGKFYAPTYRSLLIEPLHRIHQQGPDYVSVYLVAQKGVMGSSDYQVTLQAVPYEKGTLLGIKSSYRGSRVARAATQAYLQTFGRNKVGFTVVGADAQGHPIYVKGLQAVIERNVVRSYLALLAWLETAGASPDPQAFRRGLSRWYDLTEGHAMQLKELTREQYVANKQKERDSQIRLQSKEDRKSGRASRQGIR